MASWERNSGDVGDIVVVRDTGVGAVAGVDDLTTVTAVTGHVQFASGPPVVLTASVTNAAASETTVHLGTLIGDWLPAGPKAGCWRFTRHYTFVGGVGPVTWPEGEPDTIEVRAAL